MKTLATLLNEMEYDTTHEIKATFPIITKRINDLFEKIKLCQNFNDAEYYFALLERIKTLITHIYYTKKVSIPEYLWQFMSDFERIDHEWTQKSMFEDIKNNAYKSIDITKSELVNYHE